MYAHHMQQVKGHVISLPCAPGEGYSKFEWSFHWSLQSPCWKNRPHCQRFKLNNILRTCTCTCICMYHILYYKKFIHDCVVEMVCFPPNFNLLELDRAYPTRQ